MMTPITVKPRSRPVSDPKKQPLTDLPALLHEFFDRAARSCPDRIAIDVPPASQRPNRRTITYAQMQRQCNALANFLRDFIKEECVVAILLPRTSEHLYLAQLAVLKAGAAYTCIDAAFPDDQLRDILQDSRPVAVLSDATGLARARRTKPDGECFLNVIDWLDQLEGPIEPGMPPPWLTPKSLAYLIYTSGTTGHPKGVMIEHAGIANLVRGDLQQLGVLPIDRVGQSASCAYDSSVEETWFALAAGATLVVMDDETIRLGPDLIAWLRKERITMFAPSPTLLRATGCEHPETELPNLRLIHVGGEALPRDVADHWAPGRFLINDYGPTETSVTAMRGRINPGELITIGQPVPGMKAWILNENLEEVPNGEHGELCLGGVALARGYMHEPEMTAKKFPFHAKLGRIYRTGDLVHKGHDGNFYCHGRIDAQVKIRGYRIELEAIETRLVECGGVRAAACRVQGEGPLQKIVAFIVPEDSAHPPCFEQLKEALGKLLPAYMVPSHFGLLAQVPTSVSGKLNRRALPLLEIHVHEANGQVLAPRTPLEEKLALAFQEILELEEKVSVDDDFFNVLAGDSLLAAQLISKLRDDPVTSGLTVRDVYDARTVANLAKRADEVGESKARSQVGLGSDKVRPVGHPVKATIVQTLWLVLGLMLGAPVAYLLVFQALPYLTETLGMVPFVLLAPVFFFVGVASYTGFTVGFAVLVKRILIGRYRPTRAPVWGSFYVCNWIVQHTVSLVPWRLLEGTIFQHIVLRALGARIGQRVHLHRGVNLTQGGWDLLEIGDDVTLSQDAALQLVEFEDGQILVNPVTLENGCTLDIRAGVAGNTHLEKDTYLAALSFLPRGGRIPQGERWDGVPAQPAGLSPLPPSLPDNAKNLSPAVYGLALFLARLALGILVVLPMEALALVFVLVYEVDAESAAEWLFNPSLDMGAFLLGMALVLLNVPLMLLFQLLAMRLMGRVPEGVIGRWSLAYIRVWLKAGLVESANQWLTGSLLWHAWLRRAGMKFGRGSEVSSIIDTLPELVEVGAESFLADGIYLGGPRIHRGTITLAAVKLGKNTYLGNNVVIAAGQTLPDNVLLGISTVADDKTVRPGTSWFGQPPFELPNREIVECDRRFTYAPLWIRYVNRVFWESLRFALPLATFLLVLVWFNLLTMAEETMSMPVLLLGVVPALDFGVVAALCLFGIGLKWVLLGRVKPGVHPLWSCWCYRWEFHYVMWDLYAAGPLSALEGTLWLNWVLRAMGMRIGKNVVLGSGFAYLIDHDMLEFEDGATVNCMFQAHTFEDRVLKIDRVLIRRHATVGASAVLLYGADIGDRTYVLPHSVVMKRERLLPHRSYAGCPTRVFS
jgi:non-ribosomal peptide synthetase-like protein